MSVVAPSCRTAFRIPHSALRICICHYGSGRLFRCFGKHIVNDHIHLHVKIHAEREG